MKKVLIDAFSLLSPITGIGRYTYEVSERLQKLSGDRYDIFFNYGLHKKELYGVLQKQTKSEHRVKKLQLFIKKFPLLKRASRELYVFFTKFYKVEYDLYFQPNFIPNPNIKAKKVISTIHDFSFMLQPHWHKKELINYYNKNFFKLIKKADHIITGSNFTKQEIISYLQIPQESISTIYHGVNHELYKPYPQDELKKTKIKLDLPKQFLLFVGSIEPRKNLLVLLEAYDLLPKEKKEELPLILVGFKGWQNKEVMKKIEKNKEHIRYLGYLLDIELAHLYNLATIFIYPSLYEGFGLPPLEAMACGAPAIVSRVASLPEVCGDAVLYIDPANIQEIRDKILTLLNDNKSREELSQKGKSQAALFSWDKSALEHLKVLKKVLAK
ncbi:hypothetical protein M947_11335 [Sulfurimonas hongkongensis]|uniref:Glycosyl transferase family 1 n=1 Tax=Sulfurimonas hongkongensis TaxID=1172190 RepID=T0KC94_9BACT|nr:glycosyltransferase family 1 protein [Sulfurimonas hongkongensis]EQB34354.1 hypothetical protein M947_11335 [Sulfurimonas hongkongensis]